MIYLYSNTLKNNYDYIIDRITLYNTTLKNKLVTVSNCEANTILLNPVYNDMQKQNIFISSFIINNIKKKLKQDFTEKQPYFITLEHNTKYYNNYRIHLFLNENYFNNLIIKENEIKKEMNPGDFYFYNRIQFEFKNIEIEFKNYTCIFCKDFQEARKYNNSWDGIKDINEEIESEKKLKKDIPDYTNNKYIKALNQKLKEGFNYLTWYYKRHISNENTIINCDIEIFNHIEKNTYRLKIEKVLKNISNELNYKSLSENELIKILKVLNLDINTILKNIEV